MEKRPWHEGPLRPSVKCVRTWTQTAQRAQRRDSAAGVTPTVASGDQGVCVA